MIVYLRVIKELKSLRLGLKTKFRVFDDQSPLNSKVPI